MKHYNQVLPLDENDTIKNQFGWLPTSIIKPVKDKEWDAIIGDEGDSNTRRSADAQYLPNLRFSKFHPHLAEIIIRYWSLVGNTIVDPFSGRSTRAIVSAYLRRNYIGYEIVPSIAEQTKQKVSLSCKNSAVDVEIHNGDGCLLANTPAEIADLVFTCPPYKQLERYESVPSQLSDIKDYRNFLSQISLCATNIYRVMKIGAFLCWVCADWREDGKLVLFHHDCIDIFTKVGLGIHDIIIIENISPFAPLQAAKVASKRYTSKVHEYLLVFRRS